MNIPVYYHIPKCGGTYITSLYEYFNATTARIQTKDGEKFNKKSWRRVKVYINDTRFFIVLGFVSEKFLSEFISDNDDNTNALTLSELYAILRNNKIEITSIFIKPTGDGNMGDSKIKVDSFLIDMNKKPSYFTIIRDPFERLYSEYSYLTSETGIHEDYVNVYKKYTDFDNFLINHTGYDNQITRQITYGQELNDESFEIVKKFFDRYTIGTMESIKEIAIKIWQQCHNTEININNKQDFFKNENKNKPKITIDDISTKAKEQFLLKTEWDRKLYAYLSQMQIHNHRYTQDRN